MRLMRLFLTALTATTLVGCAAPPPLPSVRARAATDTHGLAVAESVKQTSNTAQHLNDDKSIVYSQNFGGGGLGLGLLLGPIGVAANAAMIESVTKADAAKMFGKVKLDPATLFREASGSELALQQAGATATVKLTPYLLITKVNESTLSPAAALIVEAPATADGKPWTTKYLFQLQGSYTIDGLAAMNEAQAAALSEQARVAYKQLIGFYLRDSNELSGRERKVVFKSGFVNPRFDFEVAGSLIEQPGAMTWLRTYGGVYALQKDSVSYTVQN